jgi:hypothetical protein
VEPEETAVDRQRLCKHVPAATNTHVKYNVKGTHGQQGALISLLSFLKIRKVCLKRE